MTNSEFKQLKIRLRKAMAKVDKLQKIYKKETGVRFTK